MKNVDPIFGAIERHKKTFMAYLNALHTETKVREAIDIRNDPEPREYIIFNGQPAHSKKEIDEIAKEVGGFTKNEIAAAKRDLMASLRQRRAWKERHGLMALEAEHHSACAAENAASEALYLTPAKTLEGVQALVAHVVAFNNGEVGCLAKGWNSETHLWPDNLENSNGKDIPFEGAILENIQKALASILTQPATLRRVA